MESLLTIGNGAGWIVVSSRSRSCLIQEIGMGKRLVVQKDIGESWLSKLTVAVDHGSCIIQGMNPAKVKTSTKVAVWAQSSVLYKLGNDCAPNYL